MAAAEITAEGLAQVGGAILAVAGVVTVFLRMFRWGVAEVVDDKIAPVKRDLHEIKMQLSPNSGQSLHDRHSAAMNRMVEEMRAIRDMLENGRG